jgi:3',5'-cyclic AMP phosphodiesterase CpdA
MFIIKKIFFFALVFVLFSFLQAFSPAWADFSFVVLGDNRDGDSVFKELIKKINQEENIAFVVNLGDLVSRGQKEEYARYEDMTSNCKYRFINVLGNHDIVSEGRKIFEKLFGSSISSWNYQNAHFIKLDNANGSIGEEQFNWLKTDLEKNTLPLIFVFMHKPTFDPRGKDFNHTMGSKEEINRLENIFEKHGVDYVIAAHVHGYSRRVKNNIVYLISGGAGAPLYFAPDNGGFYHYVRIDITKGKKITEKIKRLE